MGQIIHDILADRDGFWITPDIYTLEDLSNLQSNGNDRQMINIYEVLEEVKKRTEEFIVPTHLRISMMQIDFFDNLGFDFVINTIGEVAGNIASSKIGLDEESVRKAAGN